MAKAGENLETVRAGEYTGVLFRTIFKTFGYTITDGKGGIYAITSGHRTLDDAREEMTFELNYATK